MLSSQRALFDIPPDVCYLNAAGWSPLPRATQEAARAAVARKGQPWTLAADFPESQHERARAAAAALIGAVREGDLILVKGSRSVETDKVVEALRQSFPLAGNDR